MNSQIEYIISALVLLWTLGNVSNMPLKLDSTRDKFKIEHCND